MKKERIANLIDKAEKLNGMVSAWEQRFLDSVQQQVGKGRSLSSKQLDIVHRVEAKIKKALKGDPEWEAQWNEDKAWAFKVACNYYDSAPVRYYSQVLDWALANPDKIPPAHYYKKVVENKYAQKIINGLKNAPKYPAGETVMLRANARQALGYRQWNSFKNLPLFVIEPTNRAIHAAAGCLIYSLLSSTSAEMLEVEERWIKKWKVPKTPTKASTYEDCPF